MAFAYIIIALAIIGLNLNRIPEILNLILSDAFTPMAGFGAAVGWGVKRGIYSNEAGQGTAPHAAAAAEVDHPAQQGLVQAFAVYIDTLFVCSATAFMILITGAYNVHNDEGSSPGFIIQNLSATADANSPAFTQYALETSLPGMGATFVAIALFFFAFTTILAYYYQAETNIAYIRRTIKIPGDIFLLKIALLIAVFYGANKTASVAWGLGDIGVGLMAWLNIMSIVIIFFISKPAIKALKDYETQKQLNVEKYSFDPASLGIENAEFWDKRSKETKKTS
jgi:AGCS family alanine or glycine:cation symporter